MLLFVNTPIRWLGGCIVQGWAWEKFWLEDIERAPFEISTGHLHGDSDFVSCVEVLGSQPTRARVGVAPLPSHVPMPSAYSVELCPYLGHLKRYLHLRGHGVGWEFSKSLLAFICGCSSVPREVAEELNLESSPLRPGVVALTAKLKSSPSLISVPRNLSWMRCSLEARQGV